MKLRTGQEITDPQQGETFQSCQFAECDRAVVRLQVETEHRLRGVLERLLSELGVTGFSPTRFPSVTIVPDSGKGLWHGQPHEFEANEDSLPLSSHTIALTAQMAADGVSLAREVARWLLAALSVEDGSGLTKAGKREGRSNGMTVERAVERDDGGLRIVSDIRTLSGPPQSYQRETTLPEDATFQECGQASAGFNPEPDGLSSKAPELKLPIKNRLSQGRVATDIADLIGNTPLLLLKPPEKLLPFVKVWAKLEHCNPGGSVKDRSALAMILDAERTGLLREGGTIVESTSGNLGHALAMLAVTRGYRFIAVVDPKTPAANLHLFQQLGVEIVFVSEKDKFGSTQANRMLRAKEIAASNPGYVHLNQYENRAARDAHYRTTGPEIYEQLNGKVDALVGTVGTGSHLCGTAKFLKEMNPGLCVIGAEPEGSVLFGGTPAPYLQNGNGSVFIPANYDPSVLDIKLKVSDSAAMSMVRSVARANAMLFGGSSGSALQAAFEYGRTCDKPTNIVVLLPDGGSKYIDTVYNDTWMAANGLGVERAKGM